MRTHKPKTSKGYQRKKPCHTSSLDRISDLPSNVLDNILMCLPIADAVRTTILSKKWRHRWADVPQVVFDSSFLSKLKERQYSISDKLLMTTICEVLLLHSGPIHKFTLSIPGLDSCPEIDRVILFLSRKDIQDFNLCISTGGHHKLPSYIFSCLQLRSLNLSSCIFKPLPAFKGFSVLVSVEFKYVVFRANFLQNFVSNCPLLERLELDRCTEVSCLEINAPNLKMLYYNGSYKSTCFKKTPLLSEVYIYDTTGATPPSETQKISNLIEFFRSLAAVDCLGVDSYLLKTMAVPDASNRLPSTLNHLKDFGLYDLCFAEVEVVSCVLWLIRSSPNLQVLGITMHNKGDSDPNPLLQLLEAHGHLNFSLNKLEEVKLLSFNGTGPEMEFVKFLLAQSSALKTMHIQLPSEMVEQVKILKEIISFQRASPKAQIICGDLDSVL